MADSCLIQRCFEHRSDLTDTRTIGLQTCRWILRGEDCLSPLPINFFNVRRESIGISRRGSPGFLTIHEKIGGVPGRDDGEDPLRVGKSLEDLASYPPRVVIREDQGNIRSSEFGQCDRTIDLPCRSDPEGL